MPRALEASEVPALDRTVEWLMAHLPPEAQPALVHNDYKLDNVMLDTQEPARVVAVLPDTGERYLSTALFEYTELVNQPPTLPPPQPQIPVNAPPRPAAAP